MCIMLTVYIDLYIVQHRRISLYKYGAIEINKHLHLRVSSGIGLVALFCLRYNSFRVPATGIWSDII